MNSIKFRIWDKAKKHFCDYENTRNDPRGYDEWYGDLTQTFKETLNSIQEDDNLIIQQFTGLKDNNGKEIYDGDIVRGQESTFDKNANGWIDGEFENSHIWYDCHSATLVASQNHPYSETSFVFTSYSLFNIEVIGNIYESPELLKQ